MKKLAIILFLFVTNMFTQEIDKIYGLKVGDSLANNLLYNDTIKSFANNELKNTKPSKKIYHYNIIIKKQR